MYNIYTLILYIETMKNSISLAILFNQAIEKLKAADIDHIKMYDALVHCKRFPVQMADAMIILKRNGILNDLTIPALRDYQGALKFFTQGILKLHQEQLLNEENLKILMADTLSPDKKAAALCMLHQQDILNENTRQALEKTTNNPERVSRILTLLKAVDLQDEDYKALIGPTLPINFEEALRELNTHQFKLPSVLNFLKYEGNHVRLAQAYIELKHHQLDDKINLSQVKTYKDPKKFAEAIIALNHEHLDTHENIKKLQKSKNLSKTTQDILAPHLLKKSATRGFGLGLFSGALTGGLIWGMSPQHFTQFTLSLGFYHPAITLLVLSTVCAIAVGVACFIEQRQLNEKKLNLRPLTG